MASATVNTAPSSDAPREPPMAETTSARLPERDAEGDQAQDGEEESGRPASRAQSQTVRSPRAARPDARVPLLGATRDPLHRDDQQCEHGEHGRQGNGGRPVEADAERGEDRTGERVDAQDRHGTEV